MKSPVLALDPEDGTDILSRNVGMKLPVLALDPEDGTQ
jgi:hypothetical protein